MTALVQSGRFTTTPFVPESVSGAVACWVADDVALSDGAAVSSWTDRIGAFGLAQATGSKQPLYRTTGVGGQPAVDFDGSDDILVYAAANAVSTATSGHVFAVIVPDALAANSVVWNSADEATTTRRIRGYFPTEGEVRVLQNDGGTDDNLRTTTLVMSAGTAYLVEWASSGTAYTLRLNGTSDTLSAVGGSNTGDWFGDTSARDNFTLGMSKSTTEAAPGSVKIATLLVVDGAISGGDRGALHSWVASKYGITVA